MIYSQRIQQSNTPRQHGRTISISATQFGTPEQLLQVIALSLGMSPDSYRVRSRVRDIVELRFIAALFLRMHFPKVTLHQIAALFGGQDHSSIINGIASAHNLLYTGDDRFTEKYNKAMYMVDTWLGKSVPEYGTAIGA